MRLNDETEGNGSVVLNKSYSSFETTQGPYEEIDRTEGERRTPTDDRIQSSEDRRPQPLRTITNWRKWQIIISLAYANFWVAASISLQAPFFPREAESKGATPTEYGLVFGVYELVVVIMSPVFGKLIPKFSPKFFIIFGVLLCGSACCTFGLLDYLPAGKIYITMAFVVRIFEGIGAAALMTASFVTVAAAFPENVATSFSVVHTSFGFGLIVGPTIGGAIYQVGGFVVPFLVNGGFLLMGCIILPFLLPSIEDSNQERSGSIWNFLADCGIITFSLSIISSFIFLGFNAATLEPHLRQFNLKPVVLGVIFIIIGGIYAITTPIYGRICDKGVDPLTVCIFGYTLTCIGILLIGPVPFIPFKATVGTVVGSLVVIGLGVAAKLVSSFVGSIRNTRERGFPDNLVTYGMSSALMSSCCSMGAFVGPTIGGILLDYTGYRTGTVCIFSMEVFFMLILVVYMVTICFRRRNLSKDPNETDALIGQTLIRSQSYSSVPG